MSSSRMPLVGVLLTFLAACSLPTGANGDPGIEMTVGAVQPDGFMPVTIRNTGSTSVNHGGLCGAFALQRRKGDDWGLAQNAAINCPLVLMRHELRPGDEVTGDIQVSERILRDRTNEYRAWLSVVLRDENGNAIPDNMRASAPFRIE